MTMTAIELENNLANFYGTEGYTRWSILFRNHCMTDGVKFLAENAGAYWLLDAIASYHRTCMKDEMLRDMQFWTLTVKDSKATLICERDTGDVAIKQKIPYTDFPLDSIKLYVAPLDEKNYVVMLPNEY